LPIARAENRLQFAADVVVLFGVPALEALQLCHGSIAAAIDAIDEVELARLALPASGRVDERVE
jgi:hypothetical protein